MNQDEIRTGLGTKFIKQAIENDKFEYCNRSKAEACANIANEHALNFARYIHNNPCLFNNGKSMEMILSEWNAEFN